MAVHASRFFCRYRYRYWRERTSTGARYRYRPETFFFLQNRNRLLFAWAQPKRGSPRRGVPPYILHNKGNRFREATNQTITLLQGQLHTWKLAPCPESGRSSKPELRDQRAQLVLAQQYGQLGPVDVTSEKKRVCDVSI